MGLFNVNMPMLYGEGEEKAFFRLQEEIMKQSDDQSLFAWRRPADPHSIQYDGLLAKHPNAFAKSTDIVSYYHDREERTPYSMSNRGLRIDLRLNPCGDAKYTFRAVLECSSPTSGDRVLAIYLKRISYQSHQYSRIDSHLFCDISVHEVLHSGKETVYVRQQVIEPSSQEVYPTHIIELAKGPGPLYKLVDMVFHSNSDMDLGAGGIRASGHGVLKRGALMKPIARCGGPKWIPSNFPFAFQMANATAHMVSALKFERIDGERLLIVLSSTVDYNIGFDILAVPKGKDFPDIDNLYLSPTTLMDGGYMIQNGAKNMIENGAKVMIEGDHEIHLEVAVHLYKSAAKYCVVDVVVEPVTALKGTPPMLSANQPDTPQHARRGFGSWIPKLSRAQPR